MKNNKTWTDILNTLETKGYVITNNHLVSYEEETHIDEICPYDKCTKKELLKWLKQYKLKFYGEDEKGYHYQSRVLGRMTHITFSKDIELDSVPDMFEYQEQYNRIAHHVVFYKDEDVWEEKKTQKEIDKETKIYLESLEKWAESLPAYKVKVK